MAASDNTTDNAGLGDILGKPFQGKGMTLHMAMRMAALSLLPVIAGHAPIIADTVAGYDLSGVFELWTVYRTAIILIAVLIVLWNYDRIHGWLKASPGMEGHLKISGLVLGIVSAVIWLYAVKDLATAEEAVRNVALILSGFGLGGCYFLWRVRVILRIEAEEQESNLKPDSPIENQDMDLLDRGHLVEMILNIINNSPHGACLRLSVLGEWGSGKTSLMKMVKDRIIINNAGKQGANDRLGRKQCVVVWFNPWEAVSEDNLWAPFISAFENGIWRFTRGATDMTLVRRIKTLVKGMFSDQLSQTNIGFMLDELLNSGEIGSDYLKKEVSKKMPGERTVVFIDDMDRLDDPKKIMKLMMGITEIVDLDDTIFILGMDDRVVARVIEKELGIDSGYSFIDKIIDFQVRLPEPFEIDVNRLVKGVMDDNRQLLAQPYLEDIHVRSFQEIARYLPPNPRIIKRMLLYINLMAPALQNFDPEELEWRFLYLAQFLGLYYPGLMNYILKADLNSCTFFSDRLLARMLDPDNKETAEEYWKEYLALALNSRSGAVLPVETSPAGGKMMQAAEKERLIGIFEKMRVYASSVKFKEKSRQILHLGLVQSPDMISDKEFSEYVSSGCDRSLLIKWSSEGKRLKGLRYVSLLLQKRREMLETMSNKARLKLPVPDNRDRICQLGEQIEGIVKMTGIEEYAPDIYTMVLDGIITNMESLSQPNIRDVEDFIKQDCAIARIVKAKFPDYPIDFLLLLKPIKKTPLIRTDSGESLRPCAMSLLSELEKFAEESAAEQIIAYFHEPGKLEEMLYRPSQSFAVQRLLSKPEPFYSARFLEELEILSAESESDYDIKRNYYDLFSFLTYDWAGRGTSAIPSNVVSILLEPRVLKVLIKGIGDWPWVADIHETYKSILNRIKEIYIDANQELPIELRELLEESEGAELIQPGDEVNA